MGLRLNVYGNDFVDLTTDFTFVDNSSYFYNGDSVAEAITYFDLYLDEETARLKKKNPNEKIVEGLGISAETADEFKEALKNVAQKFTDDEAIENKLLIELWDEKGVYVDGDRVRYEGSLYKCLQAHTAQSDWTPDVATSLWSALLIDPTNPEIQEWKQPDSTNGYSKDDIVKHNDKYYKSTIDNNVWEPGATGVTQWKECAKDGSAIASVWTAGVSYATGDMITYNGKTYKCLRDDCVWSPTDLPSAWEEVA